MGIAGLMVGWLLTYFQYVPNQEQSATSMMGIALMLSIIPGFFHALMGLLMFLYRINDRYYAELKGTMMLKGYITTTYSMKLRKTGENCERIIKTPDPPAC
jgi:GPH family glycoside/pentoside/hexuronide:cation symporter